MAHDLAQTTLQVAQLAAGDRRTAHLLMPMVYAELRQLAQKYLESEFPGHTLQATGLVHEAFLKMVDQRQVSWRGQTHFFAIAAQAMRRVLVDHARTKGRHKRGGGLKRLEFDEHLVVSRDCDEHVLLIDEALGKLAELDPRQATIVELRFFGGMEMDEVAEALDVSKRTVEADWTMARAWLRRELAG